MTEMEKYYRRKNLNAKLNGVMRIVMVVGLVWILSICTQASAQGTLHDASLKEWAAADWGNKMATARHIVNSKKHLMNDGLSNSKGVLFARAVGLLFCVDEVAVAPELGFMKVTEVTAACIVTLGWTK